MWESRGAAALLIVGVLVVGCGSTSGSTGVTSLAKAPPTSSSSTLPTSTSSVVSPGDPGPTLACGSCGDSAPATGAERDVGFLYSARFSGLIPASVPDDVAVVDAQAVCKIIALGNAPETQQQLRDTRDSRMAIYVITLQQATELIVYSQEIYCSSDSPPPVIAEAFFN